MDRPLAVLVLAAGRGTRLAAGGDPPPKVLVECLGVPLLEHVRRALIPLSAQQTVVVTGHQHERVDAWVQAHWPGATTVLQEPQLGTGHAVRLGIESIEHFEGDVLVVYGDVPQLLAVDMMSLLNAHREHHARASLLTGVLPDAGSLGRIVRDAGGRFVDIVEAKDAAGRPDILAIREFNTGIYAFRSDALRSAIQDLSKDNAQGEEYATEAVTRIAERGGIVESVNAFDPASLRGVNDHTDLADAASLLRRRIATAHMRSGVTIVDPDTTIIEADVRIGAGSVIYPFTHLARGTRIGKDAKIGPFARLRGNTVVGDRAEIGNFVECKAAEFGEGAKAKHLTYVGDAHVGAGANIGCGTITANYDGKNKHRTTIGPNASIGSGTVLVAPVEVKERGRTGANAVVLAGRDVEAGQTVVGVPARPLPDEAQGEGES